MLLHVSASRSNTMHTCSHRRDASLDDQVNRKRNVNKERSSADRPGAVELLV